MSAQDEDALNDNAIDDNGLNVADGGDALDEDDVDDVDNDDNDASDEDEDDEDDAEEQAAMQQERARKQHIQNLRRQVRFYVISVRCSFPPAKNDLLNSNLRSRLDSQRFIPFNSLVSA